MSSALVSGLIGAVLSTALILILNWRVRNNEEHGVLRWGWGLIMFGILCFAFAALMMGAFFYDADVWTDKGEFIAVTLMLVVFGLGGIGCFVEYFLVRGKYNNRKIEFYTPWTGFKEENWQDLRSVEYNDWMYWYVLEFESGKIIRLSNLLSGHGGVIEKLDQMGYDSE